MNQILKINFSRRKKLTGLLGLSLDGSRLDGVVLRRTNGSLQLQQSFSATLSLDPLTAAPELVGREIRNHLDAAGVRERRCVVGVPLKWTLTACRRRMPRACCNWRRNADFRATSTRCGLPIRVVSCRRANNT